MIIDSHCHLYYDSLANDIDNVIQRANDAGVSRLVCVGTNVEESKKCLSITENNDDIFSSSGVHPHDSKDVIDGYIDEIYELMEYESMIAIGEIGLDYFKNHSDPEIQKKVFGIPSLAALSAFGASGGMHALRTSYVSLTVPT